MDFSGDALEIVRNCNRFESGLTFMATPSSRRDNVNVGTLMDGSIGLPIASRLQSWVLDGKMGLPLQRGNTT
jgi:hypothetical protein